MAFNRKEYNKEYQKRYYQEHKEYYKEHMKKWREAHREEAKTASLITVQKVRERKKQMILDYNIRYLRKHRKFFDGEFHCPRCGRVIAVTQVHNHHTNPEDKLFNISQGIDKSYEVLTEELKKTMPVCPDCHKIITANERGHWMFKKYNSIPSSDLAVMFCDKIPVFKPLRKKNECKVNS